jgi:hypothetical protein
MNIEHVIHPRSHASSPPVKHVKAVGLVGGPFAISLSSVASLFLSGLTLTFLFGSLVPIAVGLILGHSRVGQRFVEVLTAEYEGRLLTTDVECEVVSSLDNSAVVLGSNWLFARREVWWSHWVHHQLPNVSPRLQLLASGKLNLKRTEDLGGRNRMVPQCNDFNT